MKRNRFMDLRDPHRECWELLPWLVNESLPDEAAARVADHLRDCAECRKELEFQRALRERMRAEDAIVLAPQTSLQKLLQKIDAEESNRTDDDLQRLADITSSATPAATHWPRWFTMAAVVQGIVIAALLATLWLQSHQRLTEPRFTTLSSSAVTAHGPVLRVVFAPDVAVDDLNTILRTIDAQIVAGPSEAGVYTLAVPSDPAHPDRLDAALAQLRADPRVIFSESALAPPTSP